MPTDPLDDNPIEELLLTRYPNPERIGCPGDDAIKALGEKRVGRDDPAWEHVWHCSPCFAEFKAIRDDRLSRIEGRPEKMPQSSRWWALAAVTLACFVIVGFLVIRSGTGPSGPPAVIAINLNNVGTSRGSVAEDSLLAELPRQTDEIHLTLPRFSRQGRYVVAILKSKSDTAAAALNSALSTGPESGLNVVVTLNLTNAQPGRYFLATRLEEQGQQDAAFYYPILVSSR